jgi:hypothetical protein
MHPFQAHELAEQRWRDLVALADADRLGRQARRRRWAPSVLAFRLRQQYRRRPAFDAADRSEAAAVNEFVDRGCVDCGEQPA